MAMGNNGAGPVGAPVFGNQGPTSAPVAAGAVQGQAGAPANGATPFYNASFESIYAAMCRGEIPANIGVGTTALNGVGPSANQTSLLQAMSQGVPQNGTNGIGVQAGPAGGAGQGPGIAGSISGNGGLGASLQQTLTPESATTFGGTQAVDAKQMANVPTLSSPLQYAGN